MPDSMLKVEELAVNYGAICALRLISFEVAKGEIITLIGANGAGKSTTLNAISNIIKKNTGTVIFNGNDITAQQPDRIVASGLVQVPEGRRIFANLSVRDNLQMGAYSRRSVTASERQSIKNDMERVFTVFPRLKERLRQIGGTLSGGEQQMLAMGRALMAAPKLLLLDEPSMGLAPILVDEIFSVIKRLNEEGTTVLLVEQNAYKALSLASRAYILETEEIIKSGLAAELMKDEAVKTAYLGG
jgi:branched-chain amino acid transport system ATP-binding protein